MRVHPPCPDGHTEVNSCGRTKSAGIPKWRCHTCVGLGRPANFVLRDGKSVRMRQGVRTEGDSASPKPTKHTWQTLAASLYAQVTEDP